MRNFSQSRNSFYIAAIASETQVRMLSILGVILYGKYQGTIKYCTTRSASGSQTSVELQSTSLLIAPKLVD